MDSIQEDATIKAKVQRLLADAHEILAERDLPQSVHDAIEHLRSELSKKWEDLAVNAGSSSQESKRTMAESEITKKEGDAGEFPARDYAYVPDPEEPSTWKLRLTATPGGEPDAGIVGAACAALGKGFRGQKVQIPAKDLPAVKARVRAAWKKANPDKGDDEMPDVIKEAAMPAVARQAMAESEFSYDDIRQLLDHAVNAEASADNPGAESTVPLCWVRDIYPDWFVYSLGATLFKRSYAIDDQGRVTMGEPTEVVAQTVYMPAAESAVLETDFVALEEKAVAKDGTAAIKLIQPGWGSSGYYSADVLKRDGPKVFPKGTHMYWNHPTASEEAQRPERDLRDLAAVFVKDAWFDANGPEGPGLYTKAKVLSPYKEAVEELAPYIGTSIRAWGQAKDGEAEGKKGKIIERITVGRSCDFVTAPGAGGRVVQMFEAARHGAAPNITQESVTVDEKEAQALREANSDLTAQVQRLTEANNVLQTEVARVKEALLLREAREFVMATLPGNLPEPTRARLLEALAVKPVIKEGLLDKETYKALIEKAATDEIEYIAKVTGAGQVRGMGATAAAQQDDARLKETLKTYFTELGLNETAANIAANGR